MSKKCLFLTMMALLTIITACRRASESGNAEKKEITADVGSFDRICIQAACALTFEIGDSDKLTMSGDASRVDHIILDKKDGCLVIKEGSKRFFHNGNLSIKVVSPVLKGIDLQGAGNVHLNGEIKSESMSVNMEGAGSVEADRLICKNLSANVNGAGSINLKEVTAEDVSLNMNGVGSLDANFISSGALNCSMNGVGSVHVKGHVKSFSKNVNGVGKIDTDQLEIGE